MLSRPASKASEPCATSWRSPADSRLESSIMTLHNDRIVVVRAGLMGTGIAHAFASSGFTTVIVDSNAEALKRAGLAIEKILDDGVNVGKVQADAAASAKARLSFQP